LNDGCSQFTGSPANNSPAENEDLKTAINTVASESKVDPRFIFAIVMQESNGCLRVPTTNGGVNNPGVMQSHNGAGTCNNAGVVQNPCPLSAITQMIRDGTEGVSGPAGGDGLVQLLASAGTSDASQYYVAARMYNSGSVAAGGNLGGGGATHCYCTDVANRLIGWNTGVTGCNPGTIGLLDGVAQLFSGAVNSGSSPAPAPAPAASPAASSSTPAASTPAASTPAASTPSAPADNQGPKFAQAPTPSTTSAAPTTTPSAAAVNSGETIADVSPAVVQPSSTTSTTGTGAAIAAGTACSTEGEWNCINTTSFQQCASGVWSAVEQLADGTVCKSGQSAAIQITASSRKRHLNHLSPVHFAKHARHASF
jgi:hypothetical protein